MSINNNGAVVGWGVNGAGKTKGFLYNGATYADILPTGWSSAYAYDINDNGAVVGSGYDGAGIKKGFIATPDNDGDGVGDSSDNCPGVPNPLQRNNDGDLYGNLCDNCPSVANDDQADNDNDGLGDACDNDDDNDGVADVSDNCQFVSNSSQVDFDGDGQGDACDGDDDGDGVDDNFDQCPGTAANVIVDFTGCSCAQLVDMAVPCSAAWNSHGDYVSEVAKAVRACLLTEDEKGQIIAERAQRGCGKKEKIRGLAAP
ncbi:MAG TPA: hypothetical protein DDY22_08470 [Geobacter sp.]|nr:hypothetical protein [Geobacter sp.]